MLCDPDAMLCSPRIGSSCPWYMQTRVLICTQRACAPRPFWEVMVWTHLALSPLCLSDGSQRSEWGTKSPACRAGPVALFHPELTRQHEQYRNELNHPSKLCHGIEQRFPTFLTRRHTVTIIQHNDNTIIVIQSKQTRFFASKPVAPATPGLAWTPSGWRASILCHLLGSSGESKMVRAEWRQVERAVRLDGLEVFFI